VSNGYQQTELFEDALIIYRLIEGKMQRLKTIEVSAIYDIPARVRQKYLKMGVHLVKKGEQ